MQDIAKVNKPHEFFVLHKSNDTLDLMDNLIINNDEHKIFTKEKIKELADKKIIKVTDRLYEDIKEYKMLEGRFILEKNGEYKGIKVDGNIIIESKSDNMLDVCIRLRSASDNYMYYLENSDLIYVFHTEANPNREYSCWYNDSVVSFEYNGNVLTLQAVGDIDFTLKDIKNDKTVLKIVDEENKGILGKELIKYIDNDLRLLNVINPNTIDPQYKGYFKKKNFWRVKINDNKYLKLDFIAEPTLSKALEFVLITINLNIRG